MRTARALALASVLIASGAVRGDEPQGEPRGRWALGAEVDLLPVVLSTVAGEFGVGGNVWVGVDRFRLRLVGAHLAFPSAFAPDGFADRKLDVIAAVADVFARRDFSGPWLGTGVEYWWNEARAGAGVARWESPIYTIGAGWVFPIWDGLYVTPWAAGHVLLSSPEAAAGGATWKPARLAGEVSVKVGWFLWL